MDGLSDSLSRRLLLFCRTTLLSMLLWSTPPDAAAAAEPMTLDPVETVFSSVADGDDEDDRSMDVVDDKMLEPKLDFTLDLLCPLFARTAAEAIAGCIA